MKVRYEGRRLEKLCTDEREMRRKRSDIADRLRLRIKALETAENVGELPTHDPLGKWHPLRADLEGLWAGRLSANYGCHETKSFLVSRSGRCSKS